MFYNQPLSLRFGTELLRHIDAKGTGIEPFWDKLDVAVAWVRASGMAYVSDAFTRFLGHGGQLCFVVGIDLQNTSREGLQILLDLEKHGHSETYVYHNEAGSVFHPKLYLFRNEEEARLIVGSNNLTAAGLYVNVEAGLQLDTKLTDDVIVDAMDALASWRDTSTSLAVRLDQPFLDSLYAEGYVKDEAATRPPKRSGTKPGGGSATKLFGTRSYTAPPKPSAPAHVPATTAVPPSTISATQPPAAAAPMGTVVLMRLRKARGTQTQIPFRVAGTFLNGVKNVVSAQSGLTRGLNPAQAHGNPNTIKLEIPELRHHTDTFARFEKTTSGVVYEVHDIGTPQGNQIKAILDAGFSTGDTQTSISDVAKATWWRYI